MANESLKGVGPPESRWDGLETHRLFEVFFLALLVVLDIFADVTLRLFDAFACFDMAFEVPASALDFAAEVIDGTRAAAAHGSMAQTSDLRLLRSSFESHSVLPVSSTGKLHETCLR